jgi:glycosyltransferase involved in cell wall biosynthesis
MIQSEGDGAAVNELISFVIPCLNEEESLELLYEGIIANISYDYEVIFIDDGSTDRSREVIRRLHEKDEKVRMIAFRKNFGKAAALQAGFQNCRGDIVITMDADLQDEPAEINSFIDKIHEGYDVVSGWKFRRNDPLEKRLPSKLFNKVTAVLSGVKLHDFNCGFKAYRRDVVKSISIYGELHRYIPVLAHRKGFKITEIKVKHNERRFGKSKYGVERYLRGFFDSLTVAYFSRYYDKPMHFFGRLGLISGFVGFLVCLYLAIIWLMGQPIGNRPLLMLGVLLIVVGMQFFSMGLIGDILMENSFKSRYEESHVDERLGD